jgi:hypothetical protein
MEAFGSAVLDSLDAEFERLANAPKVHGFIAVETLKNVYYSVAKAVGVGRRGSPVAWCNRHLRLPRRVVLLLIYCLCLTLAEGCFQ